MSFYDRNDNAIIKLPLCHNNGLYYCDIDTFAMDSTKQEFTQATILHWQVAPKFGALRRIALNSKPNTGQLALDSVEKTSSARLHPLLRVFLTSYTPIPSVSLIPRNRLISNASLPLHPRNAHLRKGNVSIWILVSSVPRSLIIHDPTRKMIVSLNPLMDLRPTLRSLMNILGILGIFNVRIRNLQFTFLTCFSIVLACQLVVFSIRMKEVKFLKAKTLLCCIGKEVHHGSYES